MYYEALVLGFLLLFAVGFVSGGHWAKRYYTPVVAALDDKVSHFRSLSKQWETKWHETRKAFDKDAEIAEDWRGMAEAESKRLRAAEEKHGQETSMWHNQHHQLLGEIRSLESAAELRLTQLRGLQSRAEDLAKQLYDERDHAAASQANFTTSNKGLEDKLAQALSRGDEAKAALQRALYERDRFLTDAELIVKGVLAFSEKYRALAFTTARSTPPPPVARQGAASDDEQGRSAAPGPLEIIPGGVTHGEDAAALQADRSGV